MIRQDHLSAVAHEKIAFCLHSVFAKRGNFLEKSHGIKHYTVADHTTAARTQHAARNQLQNEFLALDDDSVAGVMAGGIAGHNGEIVVEHVDIIAVAFVAPLRAADDLSSHFAQKFPPLTDWSDVVLRQAEPHSPG